MSDNYSWIGQLHIDEFADGFHLCYPDGEKYDGPYKTFSTAKGRLTMLQNTRQQLLTED